MKIPEIIKEDRKREFDLYTNSQCNKVVKAYLFKGLSHRKLDEDILHLDSNYSHGYQSMGILHFLGLKNNFKGLFKKMTIEEAIEVLKRTNSNQYDELISILSEEEKLSKIESNLDDKNFDNIIEDIELEKETKYFIGKEGKQKKFYTTVYERNPQLRKAAIQIHGTKCMACGFDFEKVYGKRGKNYIEVHHVVPLFERNHLQYSEVNPETDLITLCSNCHRMVHRKKNEVLSLAQLKDILNKNKGRK